MGIAKRSLCSASRESCSVANLVLLISRHSIFCDVVGGKPVIFQRGNGAGTLKLRLCKISGLVVEAEGITSVSFGWTYKEPYKGLTHEQPRRQE